MFGRPGEEFTCDSQAISRLCIPGALCMPDSLLSRTAIKSMSIRVSVFTIALRPEIEFSVALAHMNLMIDTIAVNRGLIQPTNSGYLQPAESHMICVAGVGSVLPDIVSE